ncbi:MAG: CAP domain-containing protein, partial [Chloroflexota bacterium]
RAMPVDDGTTLWVIIKVDNGEAPKAGNSGSGGPGYATVTCAYQLDQSKIDALISALNAYRAQNGLAPFTINEQLNEAAQAHANDMACNQLFYHNGSNGSTPTTRVAASGYAAAYVTENVYGSYPPLTGAEVISWWANDTADPRHNENLLSAKYTEIGIGYSFFNNYGYYVIDFTVPA